MLKIMYLFLFLFQLMGFGHSTSYYIDSRVGDDLNSGTSTEKPWKSFSKLNSMNFYPGDKILLSKGNTWYEQLNLKNSGSSGNPITISFYGSGNLPLIDGAMTRKHGIYIKNNNFITISGVEIRNTDHASIRITRGKEIIVENCIFYVTGHGGVFVESSFDCEIRGNNVTTPGGNFNKQTDGMYSQRNDGITFDNNNIIISNEHPDQHCDGIQSYLDQNIIIKNNYIEQRNNKTGHAQGIYATTMTGLHTYYNNVVYCPNTRSSVMGFRNLDKGRGTLKAYQNTLVGGGSNILFVSENAGIDARNNIFYSSGKTSIIRLETPNVLLESNLYFHRGDGNVIGYGKGRQSRNVAQVKNEGNEINGVYADPQFSDGFRLKNGSPAVNKGIYLGPPYDTDKNGISRSTGGEPDIGAYELGD